MRKLVCVYFFSHNYHFFLKNITIGVQNASPKKNTHHLKNVGVLFLHLIILITILRLLFLLTNLRFGLYEADYTTIGKNHRIQNATPFTQGMLKKYIFGVEYVGMDHCLIRCDFLRKIFTQNMVEINLFFIYKAFH